MGMKLRFRGKHHFRAVLANLWMTYNVLLEDLCGCSGTAGLHLAKIVKANSVFHVDGTIVEGAVSSSVLYASNGGLGSCGLRRLVVDFRAHLRRYAAGVLNYL